MGKREVVKRERIPRDLYQTVDSDAVLPLIPHIAHSRYYEPCAGAGSLCELIGKYAQCVGATDLEPQVEHVGRLDYSYLTEERVKEADYIITNPPFARATLLPMIDHFRKLRPTWLLLPADMMHNKYMSEPLLYCFSILSVGRLWWFKDEQGKKIKGVDNFAWYLFKDRVTIPTNFRGRV